MDSVFSQISRHGVRFAFPALILACLGSGVSPAFCAAESAARPSAQTSPRPAVPPDMQRIYVFDSMDKSLTPMLCRPEDPSVPVSPEGRLGILKSSTVSPSAAAATQPAGTAAAVVPVSPLSSPVPAQSAVRPATTPPASAYPAYSPTPAATAGSSAAVALSPDALQQKIQSIWKYYVRRDQAYLPQGEGPLWGPSPDPAARKKVTDFSRTYLRTSSSVAVRSSASTSAPAVVSSAPRAATSPQNATPAAQNPTAAASGGAGTAQAAAQTPAASAQANAPAAQAPTPAAQTGSARVPSSLPAPVSTAAPVLPPPSVPASRSLGM